jgi:hypothetical protein
MLGSQTIMEGDLQSYNGTYSLGAGRPTNLIIKIVGQQVSMLQVPRNYVDPLKTQEPTWVNCMGCDSVVGISFATFLLGILLAMLIYAADS